MSPSLELQDAIVRRLKADSGVIALVGNRVFDVAPASASYPYVAMSAVDDLQADAECVEAVEVTFLIDCWSRSPGTVECAKIVEAVRAALHRYPLGLTTNALVEIYCRQTRRFMDPDNKTAHGVVEMAATIELK